MRGLKVFGLCIAAALLCAFVFAAMLHFYLPPSDGAYGLPVAKWLSDPFVFFGALYGGAVCGVLSFPFAYLGTLHLATDYLGSFRICGRNYGNRFGYTVHGVGWFGGLYTRARFQSSRLSIPGLEVARLNGLS